MSVHSRHEDLLKLSKVLHYNNQDLPDLSSHSVNNTVRQQHQQQQLSSSAATLLAQEWGITDPKVLAVMLKRNQRLK